MKTIPKNKASAESLPIRENLLSLKIKFFFNPHQLPQFLIQIIRPIVKLL